MTQEEKAKAYDKALEKARQLCAYPTTKPFISDLQDLFPELKESEDEKIRKEIIEQINLLKSATLSDLKDKQFDSWITWLEKQGEQKPVEWSEEDDKMINSIAVHLNATTGGFPEDRAWADKFMIWLKSLRPQKQWKPSEEQLKALDDVFSYFPYNNYPHFIGVLKGLKEELKAL